MATLEEEQEALWEPRCHPLEVCTVGDRVGPLVLRLLGYLGCPPAQANQGNHIPPRDLLQATQGPMEGPLALDRLDLGLCIQVHRDRGADLQAILALALATVLGPQGDHREVPDQAPQVLAMVMGHSMGGLRACMTPGGPLVPRDLQDPVSPRPSRVAIGLGDLQDLYDRCRLPDVRCTTSP